MDVVSDSSKLLTKRAWQDKLLKSETQAKGCDADPPASHYAAELSLSARACAGSFLKGAKKGTERDTTRVKLMERMATTTRSGRCDEAKG